MSQSLRIAAVSLLLAGCSISNAAETPIKEAIQQAATSSKAAIHKLKPLLRDSHVSSSSFISPYSSTSFASSAIVPSLLLIPPAAQLEVPFTSQAPFKNWDEPYQNACEETSLLTVMHYLENRPFTQELADQEIVALTAKTAQMGYGISINLEQLADITNALFPQYKPVLSTDVTIDSLKRAIAQGKPVIVPTAGRILQNPYYSGEGPWYHMLVITGYDQMYFYTNDVGTGHGEHYAFPQSVLLDAIHDWVGKDEKINEGQKIMMTLVPR